MSDPLPAPQFNLTYNTPLSNIGEGYSKGIEQAGSSLAQAIGSVADIGKQNADVNDTLTAMHQTGILKPEEYQAVMNKSLGAKQSMLGLYAGQWIADEAAKRAVGQAGGTEHAQIAARMAAIRAGYGQAAGIPPGKAIVQPQQRPAAQPAPPQAPPVQPAQQPLPGEVSPGGSASAWAATAPGQRSAGSVIIGKSLGPKDPIPPGSKVATLRGQRGYLMPDGVTFSPIQ